MIKSAENWMRSNLELEIYIIMIKEVYIIMIEEVYIIMIEEVYIIMIKSSPIYLGPKNLDTILMH
jgi:hypothetical protein